MPTHPLTWHKLGKLWWHTKIHKISHTHLTILCLCWQRIYLLNNIGKWCVGASGGQISHDDSGLCSTGSVSAATSTAWHSPQHRQFCQRCQHQETRTERHRPSHRWLTLANELKLPKNILNQKIFQEILCQLSSYASSWFLSPYPATEARRR